MHKTMHKTMHKPMQQPKAVAHSRRRCTITAAAAAHLNSRPLTACIPPPHANAHTTDRATANSCHSITAAAAALPPEQRAAAIRCLLHLQQVPHLTAARALAGGQAPHRIIQRPDGLGVVKARMQVVHAPQAQQLQVGRELEGQAQPGSCKGRRVGGCS